MRKLTGWQWSCVALCAGVGGLLTGCSTSSSSSSPNTGPSTAPASPTASASPTGGTGGAAQAQIKANWEAFFSPKTPTARRIQLLQNGSQFAAVIQAQAKSVLAQSASAKVLQVSVASPTLATVTYNIVAAGAVALKNQTGTAVLQGGLWKVGDSSFCGLLILENGGKSSGLPAACKAA